LLEETLMHWLEDNNGYKLAIIFKPIYVHPWYAYAFIYETKPPARLVARYIAGMVSSSPCRTAATRRSLVFTQTIKKAVNGYSSACLESLA
jgi:hypothetical protein